MTLLLEEKHRFKAGDRLVLKMSGEGTNVASFITPHPWDPKWTTGVRINEIHESSSVAGSTVRLAEPLMIDVDAGGDWRAEETYFISEIGIENICFRGGWK